MPGLLSSWIQGRFPAELKDEYRQFFLKSDIKQARIAMLILMIPLLFFIYHDFVYSPGPVFLIIALCGRTIFFTYTIVLSHYINKITDYKRYDLQIFIWALCGTALIIITNLIRPDAYMDSAMVHIVILSIMYFGIPNRFLNWIIIGIIYSIASLYMVFTLGNITPSVMITIIAAIILVNAGGIFIVRLTYFYRRNHFLSHYKLEKLASIDSLTGIMNRRILLEHLENELKRYHRYHRQFCLLTTDIDEFKQINDNYGHLEGDEVLKEYTKLVNSEIRQSDIFGRTGGEEFCIILINTSVPAAEEIAERIVQKCREKEVRTASGEIIRFSISTGIACVQKDDTNIDQLLNRADAAMYRAKEEGKDRVKVFEIS